MRCRATPATAPCSPRLSKTVSFFAGEATHPHFFSTAHGAYETGSARGGRSNRGLSLRNVRAARDLWLRLSNARQHIAPEFFSVCLLADAVPLVTERRQHAKTHASTAGCETHPPCASTTPEQSKYRSAPRARSPEHARCGRTAERRQRDDPAQQTLFGLSSARPPRPGAKAMICASPSTLRAASASAPKPPAEWPMTMTPSFLMNDCARMKASAPRQSNPQSRCPRAHSRHRHSRPGLQDKARRSRHDRAARERRLRSRARQAMTQARDIQAAASWPGATGSGLRRAQSRRAETALRRQAETPARATRPMKRRREPATPDGDSGRPRCPADQNFVD